MLRRFWMVFGTALVLGFGGKAIAQLPEPLPVPVTVTPAEHQYPPGVIDMTPAELPGPPTSPTCYFVPADDAIAPFVVSAEYLLIRPHRRDLDYVIVDPKNNLAPEGRIASLDWQTRSGVRAGFMWRPRNSSTDLAFTYTYAYSRDSASIAAPAGGVLFPSLTRPGIVDQALTAQAFSSINYNVFDIDVGRRFTVRRELAAVETGNAVGTGRRLDAAPPRRRVPQRREFRRRIGRARSRLGTKILPALLGIRVGKRSRGL